MRFLTIALIAASACGRLAAADAHLTLVYGGKHLELTAADLAKLPVHEVQAVDHKVSHLYRGVYVRDVLALLDLPFGEKMRGRTIGLAVRAKAPDGYVAAFALAEFDDAFRDQPILLVDTEDGKPLADRVGPWRFVCPGDKRPARWIRRVAEIDVVSLASD